MATLANLLPELLTVIGDHLDAPSVFALRHTSKWSHDNLPQQLITRDLMNTAAYLGYTNILDWFRPIGCTAEIVRGGSSQVNSTHVYWVCNYAAKGGQLETLQWLYNNGFIPYGRIFLHAAYSGNVKMFDWLKSVGFKHYDAHETFFMAAAGGYVEILEWIKANRYISFGMGIYAAKHAAATGQTHVIEWLAPILSEYGQKVLIVEIAAFNGHLDTVQWLLHDGHSHDEAMVGARLGNQTAVMDYLSSRGVSRDIDLGYIKLSEILPEYDAKSQQFIRYRMYQSHY